MKILVSACLLGQNCKYNGSNNYRKDIIDFLQGHDVISVCPEVMGGLSIPRIPAEIVDGIVMTKDVMTKEHISVDEEFRRGADIALKRALDEQVDLAILQSRSPSCGVNQIYDGSFSGKLIDGQGVFAQMLKKAGIRIVDADDIDSLI